MVLPFIVGIALLAIFFIPALIVTFIILSNPLYFMSTLLVGGALTFAWIKWGRK